MKIKMTLWGLIRLDGTLFDNMLLPQGVDKEALVNTILFESNEFPVAYPDLGFLKNQINLWSRRRYGDWMKILTALTEEYSTIENYNSVTENVQKSVSEKLTESQDSGNSSGTNENQNDMSETAFDSYDYRPTGRNKDSGRNSGNYENMSLGGENEDSTVTFEERKHGNIGVTTNQQMINQELELRKADFYKIVADEFVENFMIMVY